MKSAKKKKSNKRKKFIPQIYKDVLGVEWITAEGIRKYFRISLPSGTRTFYSYDEFLKGVCAK